MFGWLREAAIRESVACNALVEHMSDVKDPSVAAIKAKNKIALIDQECITQYMNAAGYPGIYAGNHKGPEWCVMFWVFCWDKYLKFTPKQRATYLISTYRVMELWRNHTIFGVPCPVNPNRKSWKLHGLQELPSDCVPLPGDLLIVGDGSPAWGDHACVVIGYDPKRKVFHTIEGNAGRGKEHGVINTERPLIRSYKAEYCAMYLYRLDIGDLNV